MLTQLAGFQDEQKLLGKFVRLEDIEAPTSVVADPTARRQLASPKGQLDFTIVTEFVKHLLDDPLVAEAQCRMLLGPSLWKSRFQNHDVTTFSEKGGKSKMWSRVPGRSEAKERIVEDNKILEVIGVALLSQGIADVGHYVAYKVDFSTDIVTVYESLEGEGNLPQENFIEAAKEIAIFLGKPRKPYTCEVKKIAKQQNGFDCGVYASLVVQQLSLGNEPEFCPESLVPAMRGQMMLSLITGKTYDKKEQ